MTDKKLADEELITNYYSCDDAAFTQLYQRYYSRLVVFSHHFDFRDSEDLAEEVFLRVIRTKETGKGRWKPPWSFKTWLYAIATNVGRDQWRRIEGKLAVVSLDDATPPILEPADPGPDPLEVVLEREGQERKRVAFKEALKRFKRDLDSCLGKLDVISRLALLLRSQRMTQEETAGILSSAKVGGTTWSDSTISRIEKKALSALMHCLQACWGSEFIASLTAKEWRKAILGTINGGLVAEEDGAFGGGND